MCLLREDAYKQIIGLTRLSNNTLLSGIVSSKIYTKGSLEEIEIDGSIFFRTWHTVLTAQLNYQAVIGINILDQARMNFDKNGLNFISARQMGFLCELSKEDEVELNHIHDS